MDIREVDYFISNSFVHYKTIQENTVFEGRKLPRRFIFVKLKKYVKEFINGKTMEPRMVGIAGIRGVGKTTLLWQLAGYVKSNFRSTDIYFLSMDIASGYGFEISDLIEGLKNILPNDKKVVLLFDEVQYMDKWTLLLKIIYDRFKNVFIIATGSSSLLINSTVDLSTRWHVDSLYPLNFPEFVIIRSWIKNGAKSPIFPIKGLSSKIKESLFFSKDVWEVKDRFSEIEKDIKSYFEKFNQYEELGKGYVNDYVFYYNIPRLLAVEDKNTLLVRVFDMLYRVLYQDLKEFYDQNEVMKIKRFLTLLAFSDEINRNKMAKTLGVKIDKVDKIVDSLVKSEILLRFPIYGGVKTRVKKEKLFFVSPTIRYAIIRQLYSNPDKFHSKFYEDIIALYLRKIFNGFVLYSETEKSRTPDFIVSIGDSIIPIEIGDNKQDISQVDYIKGKKYGILLNIKGQEVKVKGNNVIIPFKWFLLI